MEQPNPTCSPQTPNAVCCAAESYLARGWTPIPIPFRKKAPNIKGWPTLRLQATDLPRHFGGAHQNVGVLLGEPSGWLVDIDLDCPEAVDLAPEILPPTDAVFGRPGNPRSHWLYLASGAETVRLNTPDAATDKRTTLVELRSTGAQTVFPPSTHTTGEPVSFEAGPPIPEPARVDAEALTAAVRRLAAAAFLVRSGHPREAAVACAEGDERALAGLDETIRAEAMSLLESEAGSRRTTATTKSRRPRRMSNSETNFDDAARRYNTDYPRTWPSSNGTCPGCGHHDCFRRLADNDDRWVCFSASHTGPGIEGDRCWHGDALDLDAHAAGLTRADLLRREGYLSRRSSPHDHRVHPRTERTPGTLRLPEIQTNKRQLRDIIGEAWAAIRRANSPPRWFRRRGTFVRVVEGATVPRLEAVDEATAYGLLARTASWFSVSNDERNPTKPVKEVAKDLVAYPHTTLPVIEEIVTFPVYDDGGRLVAAPGFDAEAALWLHLGEGCLIPRVSAAPTPSDVARAKRLILSDLLCDFPFASEGDRAHAVAALILPFVRRLIDSPTPLHLIEAPTPGTGKSLLANAIAVAVTGQPAAALTFDRNEEEVRKRVTAALLRSQQVILIDNVRVGLKSANLAAVLTATIWSDRVLGASKVVDVPNRALWMATANNPELSMEIARRCLRIRLDAQQDQPWTGREFKHDRLLSWTMAHRSDLLCAVLTFVSSWLAAGRPAPSRTLGSYESWADVVGGVLEHVGIAGFLCNLEQLYEDADAETAEWRAFVQAWHDRWGSDWVRATDLLKLCDDHHLLAHVVGDRTQRSREIRLGRALGRMRDRRLGEYRIERRPGRAKAAEYRVHALSGRSASQTGFLPGLGQDGSAARSTAQAGNDELPDAPGATGGEEGAG